MVIPQTDIYIVYIDQDYSFDCDQPRTALEAIKSTENHNKKMKNKKCLDDCSCLSNGVSLIISCESEKVEEAQNRHKTIHSRDKYSVVYINTVRGKNTKTKKLFKNTATKKYLCVYGEKGVSVKDAVKHLIDLSNVTLSDNDNPNCLTKCTEKVDNLDKKKIKFCPPRKKRTNCERRQVTNLMESFSQQAFDKHCLFDGTGSTVCLLYVDYFQRRTQGTGFVLFDNYILTNAHLLKDCVELQSDNWQKHTKVTALFNYENPDSNWITFDVKSIVVINNELDYAVLELDLEAQNKKVPPGLLNILGPMPLSGILYIRGFPFGLKKNDTAPIIEKWKRKQPFIDILRQFKDPHNLQLFIDRITEQGIEDIMMGGNKANKVVTYNSFMYDGSSGSPVFDAYCKLIGLHTRGYVYDSKHPNHTMSVLEYAQCPFTIFEGFVNKLMENGNYKVLKRVEEEAKGNTYPEKILESLSLKLTQKEVVKAHTVGKLLKLDGSVCLLNVDNYVVDHKCSTQGWTPDSTQGTGFVLLDNYILTNAHLLKDCVELQSDNWQKHTKVTALFNYENPDSNWITFDVKSIVVINNELDYAVLELDLETQNKKVPPGLLNILGPMPLSGILYIRGFPFGLKKTDTAPIIETWMRKQPFIDILRQFKDPHNLQLFIDRITEQGIEDIMMGGNKADKVVTYNSSMYHGSSGSPVFDANCKLIGLHTRGYEYGPPNHIRSVFECAQSLLTIFEDFVMRLLQNGNYKVLKRVEEEAKGNTYLEKILESLSLKLKEIVEAEPADPEECSDSDEPMEID